MIKKTTCILLIFLLLFSLGGCWNYRSLDEMTIVTGIAIDKNPARTNYQLTFEAVDMSVPVKTGGINSMIIESEGKTLFDAVRNAKKKVASKLYFGQTQIVIFSEYIASHEDINGIVDWILRDGEGRETIYAVISQEKSARAILTSKGIGQNIVSSYIRKNFENDEKAVASTLHVELYEIYNIINGKGKSLTLPAIHNVINDGELVAEANGTAVFKEKRLVGYLTPEESKYHLFLINKIGGGVLAISCSKEGTNDITLEISKNTTKRSFEVVDGKIKILINTNTVVYLGEVIGHGDEYEKEISALEDAAEAALENNIGSVIQRVQSEYGSDIFGFGNMIYKKDIKLWNQIGDTWEEQFKTVEVQVQSNVQIVNTGTIVKP